MRSSQYRKRFFPKYVFKYYDELAKIIAKFGPI